MISRKIWLLWFQGWDDAPELVRSCLRTWRTNNVALELVQLTNDNLADYLRDDELFLLAREKQISHAAMSDVIRVAILRDHGGVWADSTTFCLKALDLWIDSHAPVGFFAFDRPTADRMISSWFLASEANGYIIAKYYDACLQYWKNHARPHEYYWFHQLFGKLYRSDDKFKTLWDATPRVSARGPHYFVPYEHKFHRRMSADDMRLLRDGHVPMLKLTHKVTSKNTNSVYDYLVHRDVGSGLAPPQSA